MDSFIRRLPIIASTAVLLTGLIGVSTPAMAGVVPASTFDIEIDGFNSTGTTGYLLLASPLQTTFGSTQVFDGVGPEGQNITVSSSESVGATTTTDTVIVSTPTNFFTGTKIGSTKIEALQFDIGDANANNAGITLTSAPTSLTESGYILYGTAETQFNLTPTDYSSGTTLAAAEGVSYAPNYISTLAVNEFELSFTYANPVAVPEPATLGAFGAGLLGLFTVAQRRRFTQSGERSRGYSAA
jgi:hypothetical protein